MADSSVDVVLRLKGANRFQRDAKDSGRAVDKIGRSGVTAGKGLDQANKKASLTRKGFRALGTAAKYGAFALGGFTLVAGKKSVDAASNLQEQLAKTGTVFRGSEKDVHRWSKGMAMSFGVSRREALESAGVFGNMLVPMGLSRGRAADMSKQFVELAADMASFNNASPTETLDALRAGLAGETEPLRRFGVMLTANRVAAKAAAMGFKEVNGELPAQAKALAVQALILKDTKDAQGDVARTSGSWANVQRRLAAVTEDLGAKLGQKLIPILEKGGTWLAKFVGQMESGKGAGGEFAETVTNIWESAKPVVQWFGRAAANVAKFVAKNPGLGKLLATVGLVGVALRKLPGGTFLSKHILKGLGGLGKKLLERVKGPATTALTDALGSAGKKGGSTAATNVASTAATSVGPNFTSRKGKFTSVGKSIGRWIGLGAGPVAVALIAESFGDDILDAIVGPGGADAAKRDQNLRDQTGGGGFDIRPWKWGDAAGGLIGSPSGPRGDRLPRLAEHGEFMVRRKAVERLGIPALNRINEGMLPAVATAGGGGGPFEGDVYLDGAKVGRVFGRQIRKDKARR